MRRSPGRRIGEFFELVKRDLFEWSGLVDFEYYKRVGLSGNDLIEKCEEQLFDLNLDIVLLFVKKQGKQEISELNQAERNQLLAIIWDKHKLGFAQRLYGVANTDKSLKKHTHNPNRMTLRLTNKAIEERLIEFQESEFAEP